MSRLTAMLVALVLLGSAGCSAGPHDKTSDGCAGQAGPCHQPPDHSSSGEGNGGGMGNGGMGHGMM
jgi:hypothetical protein